MWEATFPSPLSIHSADRHGPVVGVILGQLGDVGVSFFLTFVHPQCRQTWPNSWGHTWPAGGCGRQLFPHLCPSTVQTDMAQKLGSYLASWGMWEATLPLTSVHPQCRQTWPSSWGHTWPAGGCRRQLFPHLCPSTVQTDMAQ
jgi:hypothetical protein